MKLLKSLIGASILSASVLSQAAILTTGDVTLTVNESTGAISSFEGFGTDYFNHGTFVANYGLMVEGNNSSYTNILTNAASVAGTNINVSGATVGATSVSVFGNYFNDFDFIRTYSLVGGVNNIIALTMQITNNTGAAASILGYETFDPDQGITPGLGYSTINDVIEITPGFLAATSVNTDSLNPFLIGSPDAVATSAGGLFQIDSATDLLSVLNSPFDANGATADNGSHVVHRYNLAANQTVSTTTYLGTASGDLASLVDNLNNIPTVNAPASISIFMLGLLAMVRRIAKN